MPESTNKLGRITAPESIRGNHSEQNMTTATILCMAYLHCCDCMACPAHC